MRFGALLITGAVGVLAATAADAGQIMTNGAYLPPYSISRLDWSSDLGNDYVQGPFTDSVNYGTGVTTPLKASGSGYRGEALTVSIGPLVNFGGSRGDLSTSVTWTSPPAGQIDGAVGHVHFENSVPTVTGYGLFASSGLGPTPYFYGGTPGATEIYFAYTWQMKTDIVGPTEVSATYLVDLESDLPGARLEVPFGVTPGNFGGSATGRFDLRDFNNIDDGMGPHAAEFAFGLSNPAQSGSTGGSASFDVWYEYSDVPIDHVDIPGNGVPEPATWALLIAGFGGIGAAMRRRRAAPSYA